jgi:hypothetical protein
MLVLAALDGTGLGEEEAAASEKLIQLAEAGKIPAWIGWKSKQHQSVGRYDRLFNKNLSPEQCFGLFLWKGIVDYAGKMRG